MSADYYYECSITNDHSPKPETEKVYIFGCKDEKFVNICKNLMEYYDLNGGYLTKGDVADKFHFHMGRDNPQWYEFVCGDYETYHKCMLDYIDKCIEDNRGHMTNAEGLYIQADKLRDLAERERAAYFKHLECFESVKTMLEKKKNAPFSY